MKKAPDPDDDAGVRMFADEGVGAAEHTERMEDGTNPPRAEEGHPASLPFGWFEFVARRTLRPGLLSEHHQCSALKEVMSGRESTGFVRVEFYERGPGRYRSGARKGQLRWGGKETERVAIVSRAEMRGVMADWERKTGRCAHCTDGRTLAKWSVTEGSTYRSCRHCNGTQRAGVPHEKGTGP